MIMPNGIFHKMRLRIRYHQLPVGSERLRAERRCKLAVEYQHAPQHISVPSVHLLLL